MIGNTESTIKKNNIKRKSQNLKGLHCLKSALISQSFSPLYLLILIKYADVRKFCSFYVNFLGSAERTGMIKADLLNDKGSVIITFILTSISMVVIIRGFITYFFFENLWKTNSIDKGERISVDGYELDVGITFFVTYVLPLMLDDIDTVRGFIVFMILMLMMEVLLRRSNLYYQNPILTMMGYRVFRFKFTDTMEAGYQGKEFIGLTKGKMINEDKPVKRRMLDEGIVIVFGKK